MGGSAFAPSVNLAARYSSHTEHQTMALDWSSLSVRLHLRPIDYQSQNSLLANHNKHRFELIVKHLAPLSFGAPNNATSDIQQHLISAWKHLEACHAQLGVTRASNNIHDHNYNNYDNNNTPDVRCMQQLSVEQILALQFELALFTAYTTQNSSLTSTSITTTKVTSSSFNADIGGVDTEAQRASSSSYALDALTRALDTKRLAVDIDEPLMFGKLYTALTNDAYATLTDSNRTLSQHNDHTHDMDPQQLVNYIKSLCYDASSQALGRLMLALTAQVHNSGVLYANASQREYVTSLHTTATNISSLASNVTNARKTDVRRVLELASHALFARSMHRLALSATHRDDDAVPAAHEIVRRSPAKNPTYYNNNDKTVRKHNLPLGHQTNVNYGHMSKIRPHTDRVAFASGTGVHYTDVPVANELLSQEENAATGAAAFVVADADGCVGNANIVVAIAGNDNNDKSNWPLMDSNADLGDDIAQQSMKNDDTLLSLHVRDVVAKNKHDETFKSRGRRNSNYQVTPSELLFGVSHDARHTTWPVGASIVQALIDEYNEGRRDDDSNVSGVDASSSRDDGLRKETEKQEHRNLSNFEARHGLRRYKNALRHLMERIYGFTDRHGVTQRRLIFDADTMAPMIQTGDYHQLMNYVNHSLLFGFTPVNMTTPSIDSQLGTHPINGTTSLSTWSSTTDAFSNDLLNSENSVNKAYFYSFSSVTTTQHLDANDKVQIDKLSAKYTHDDELFYLLGGPVRYLQQEANDSERDYELKNHVELSRTMLKYWSNFFHHGNPNGPKMANGHLSYWPHYDSWLRRFMQLSLTQQKAQAAEINSLGPIFLWADLMPLITDELAMHKISSQPSMGADAISCLADLDHTIRSSTRILDTQSKFDSDLTTGNTRNHPNGLDIARIKDLSDQQNKRFLDCTKRLLNETVDRLVDTVDSMLGNPFAGLVTSSNQVLSSSRNLIARHESTTTSASTMDQSQSFPFEVRSNQMSADNGRAITESQRFNIASSTQDISLLDTKNVPALQPSATTNHNKKALIEALVTMLGAGVIIIVLHMIFGIVVCYRMSQRRKRNKANSNNEQDNQEDSGQHINLTRIENSGTLVSVATDTDIAQLNGRNSDCYHHQVVVNGMNVVQNRTNDNNKYTSNNLQLTNVATKIDTIKSEDQTCRGMLSHCRYQHTTPTLSSLSPTTISVESQSSHQSSMPRATTEHEGPDCTCPASLTSCRSAHRNDAPMNLHDNLCQQQHHLGEHEAAWSTTGQRIRSCETINHVVGSSTSSRSSATQHHGQQLELSVAPLVTFLADTDNSHNYLTSTREEYNGHHCSVEPDERPKLQAAGVSSSTTIVCCDSDNKDMQTMESAKVCDNISLSSSASRYGFVTDQQQQQQHQSPVHSNHVTDSCNSYDSGTTYWHRGECRQVSSESATGAKHHQHNKQHNVLLNNLDNHNSDMLPNGESSKLVQRSIGNIKHRFQLDPNYQGASFYQDHARHENNVQSRNGTLNVQSHLAYQQPTVLIMATHRHGYDPRLIDHEHFNGPDHDDVMMYQAARYPHRPTVACSNGYGTETSDSRAGTTLTAMSFVEDNYETTTINNSDANGRLAVDGHSGESNTTTSTTTIADDSIGCETPAMLTACIASRKALSSHYDKSKVDPITLASGRTKTGARGHTALCQQHRKSSNFNHQNQLSSRYILSEANSLRRLNENSYQLLPQSDRQSSLDCTLQQATFYHGHNQKQPLNQFQNCNTSQDNKHLLAHLGKESVHSDNEMKRMLSETFDQKSNVTFAHDGAAQTIYYDEDNS
ncbi:hypothetical protein GZH46_00939, partial [Fragariocoptes setiger]